MTEKQLTLWGESTAMKRYYNLTMSGDGEMAELKEAYREGEPKEKVYALWRERKDYDLPSTLVVATHEEVEYHFQIYFSSLRHPAGYHDIAKRIVKAFFKYGTKQTLYGGDKYFHWDERKYSE
jgi:hypothetical protein